jgi:predicted DNA-binding mobile mystery protein A
MSSYSSAKKARETIGKRVSEMRPTSRFTPPRLGWVRAVRDALGMSADDLGRRMGITGASVRSIEKNEQAGGVRLSTLRRAAEAMDCEVVYALVPKESLDATVKRQARRILREQWQRVDRSMALEDQATEMTESAEESQLEAIIRSGRLWSSMDSPK